MKLNFQEEHAFWYFGPAMPPFPMIPVKLIGRRGQTAETYALLDSGADQTMFHANWARKIGIDLYSGRKEDFGTWIKGQERVGYVHRIDMIIGTVKVRADVAFCEDMGEELNDQLIGRATVFNRMRFALRQYVEKTYIGSMP